MQKKTLAMVGATGVAGVLAGGVLAATLSASAAGDSGTTTTYGAPRGAFGNGNTDPSKPMRSDEHLLTGTTKAKVLAAVTKKYPNATVQRVETDSDGVYEAHVLLNGAPTIVQVGKDFTITGTQQGPGGGRGAAPGAAPGA